MTFSAVSLPEGHDNIANSTNEFNNVGRNKPDTQNEPSYLLLEEPNGYLSLVARPNIFWSEQQNRNR